MKPLKLKVEDVEYEVSIPLYLMPYVTMFHNMLAQNIKSEDEAEKVGQAMKSCYDKLKPYIRPEPDENTFIQLIIMFNVIVAEKIAKAVKEASFLLSDSQTLTL